MSESISEYKKRRPVAGAASEKFDKQVNKALTDLESGSPSTGLYLSGSHVEYVLRFVRATEPDLDPWTMESYYEVLIEKLNERIEQCHKAQ